MGRSTLPPKPPSAAERWFRLGADLARLGRYRDAIEPLEQALAYSVEEPGEGYHRALRSWYGLAVALARGDVVRGRRLCEEAVADSPRDADLYVNLCRVYMRSSRRDLSIEALKTALAFDPHHPSANSLMQELGQRSRPVFAFLDRRHPLNRYVGKIRHRLSSIRVGR